MTILKNIKDMILEQIQNKANRSELPTRVSDLDNDLNLVTEEDVSGKADISSLSNVAFSGDYDDLTDKPTIPSASNTTPSADTLNGSVGDGVTWARSNHKHPKSDLYAEASHTHSTTDVTDSNSGNYSNLGELNSGVSQQVINNAINSKLGSLTVDVIEWDTADNNGYPSTTASSSTMNKFFLIENIIDSESEEPYIDEFKLKITGSSFETSEEATIPFDYTGTVTIEWGDGNTETYTGEQLSHTYNSSGDYEIIITGNVTSINDLCFSNNVSSLVGITIPSSVTSLGKSAFSRCKSLKKIIIPPTVTSIAEYCFYSSGLEEVEIQTNITSLGRATFMYCDYLEKINIPSSITSLGDSCFYSSGLTSISIPSSVTSIGNSCFKSCQSLVNYQLWWTEAEDIIPYSSNKMTNNTNTVFTIPYGTTSDYESAEYPSAKLVERPQGATFTPINSNESYNIFVTKRTGTSGDSRYNWELVNNVLLDISGKADISSLSNVAFSGDYDDLTDKPTIPVDVSDLTDTQNTAFTPKTHTHNISDMGDMETVPIVVTYTDTTTETLQMVIYKPPLLIDISEDSRFESLSLGDCYLYDSNDRHLIGTASNDNGQYVFKNIPYGEYFMSIDADYENQSFKLEFQSVVYSANNYEFNTVGKEYETNFNSN